MKKITIMYDFLKELGGLERVMFFQANKLKKYFDVELLFSYISQNEKEAIARELGLSKDIKISQIGHSKNEIISLMLAFLFPSRITDTKTDLLLSHSFMCSRMAYKKKMQDNTPYIIMIHHPPNFLYSRNIQWVNNPARFFAYLLGAVLGPIVKKMDKAAVKNADMVLVNSNYTAGRIKQIYGIEPFVIYPPISPVFRPINKENAGKLLKKFKIDGDFILLHGRMIKDKRPDLAVEAFSKIKTDALLVISGTIEEEKKIKKMVKTLNLENKVKMLGRVSEDELVALYNLAKCFIMSAPKEDFGLTTVEAMACGCPVVAWRDNAGPQEIISENTNGLLAEPYNTTDLAKKIDAALENKWNKEKITGSVKKFSQDKIGSSLASTVKRII